MHICLLLGSTKKIKTNYNSLSVKENHDKAPEYHQQCLISGNKTLTPLKTYKDHYLVKCKESGFVFCSRIPSNEELTEHYNSYERNNYISPITVNNYQVLLKSFESYRDKGNILDIGCGDGYFLAEAKKMGWNVYGTEFTDEAITVCAAKGINMSQGPLDSANYNELSFDIITSFEVLEHINNPREEIDHINKMLRKGGLMYLTTPNFNALERYILKDKYSIIQYPEHLSYYTPKTLNYLYTSNGFKKQKIRTTGISLTRLKNGWKKYDEEPLVSAVSSDEILRSKLSSNKVLNKMKLIVNDLLSILGIGNSLKGWFIKL